jgi:hypothetical protein
MKAAALAAIGALGLASVAASAAPTQAAPVYVQTINASWGCGPGWHPDYWGRCVPNYGFYGGPRVVIGFGGPGFYHGWGNHGWGRGRGFYGHGHWR